MKSLCSEEQDQDGFYKSFEGGRVKRSKLRKFTVLKLLRLIFIVREREKISTYLFTFIVSITTESDSRWWKWFPYFAIVSFSIVLLDKVLCKKKTMNIYEKNFLKYQHRILMKNFDTYVPALKKPWNENNQDTFIVLWWIRNKNYIRKESVLVPGLWKIIRLLDRNPPQKLKIWKVNELIIRDSLLDLL